MLNYLLNKCYLNLLFLILFLINGCAYHNIEKLKSTPESNNQFSQALSEAYLEFALFEMNEMHDELDASYFAKKGIKARSNENVYPEMLNNWSIDNKHFDHINKKRLEITKILNSERAKNFPTLSARTQLGFDCWLEQLEEAWQINDIQKCYNMMNSSLITLKNPNINHNKAIVANTHKNELAINNQDKEIKNIKEITKIENSEDKLKFEIYFEHDSYQLKQKTKNVINNIYNKYLFNKEILIEVIGHTDRSGSENYNIILSKLRANSVKKYLLSKGISEFNIGVYYFGEKKPKIATKDGVKEKINRRVEIFINNLSNHISEL